MDFKAEFKVVGTVPNIMHIMRNFQDTDITAKQNGLDLIVAISGSLQKIQELKRRLGGKRNRKTHVEVLSLCRTPTTQ